MGETPMTTPTLGARLRDVALTRADTVLAELPATLRRLRLLLLVVAVSVPLFLAAVLALLAWRLA